ncbi:tetratricopeptide repeat protein [Streptomyces sp. HC44]|uniref:Tetratricopeptide repeat protein n=1 Tax=Streptomyces scabichelini TaxID=2711217 RepID=A0A6G4VCU8_9ACTN|nr:FxSxx-COOH system tetratricopeptide repeat protein [Streptomyces scabichelini]NGO11919.1 tetratricopeptide repeat protein [Streptomyces scabichelini]
MATAPRTPVPPPDPLGSADLTPYELSDGLWLAMCLAGRTRPRDGAPSVAERHRHEPRPGEPPRPAPAAAPVPDGENGELTEPRQPSAVAPDPTPALWAPAAPRVVDAPVPGPPAVDTVSDLWTAVPGLENRRMLERALRPFRRTVPSAHSRELDEERTAEALVEAEPRLPRYRPARERWLDLVLVVDAGASMAAWRHSVTEFARLLNGLGAFRTISIRLLSTNQETDGELRLRGPSPSAPAFDLPDPASPPRRRAVLVLTDGAGAAWRSGAAQRLIARWSERVPVVVTHLLPHRSWYRTWVATRPARIRATGPLACGPRLTAEVSAAGVAGAKTPIEPAVPVIELAPRWLARWAHLLTGDPGDWPGARMLSTEPTTYETGAEDSDPEVDDDLAPGRPPTPAERILAFRASSSPTAFRLIQQLAVAPLDLAVMETVQHLTQPGSRPAHMAEILTSGLLVTEDGPSTDPFGPTAPRYAFLPGVAEELLATSGRAATAEVMLHVITRLAVSLPEMRDLAQVLTTPWTDRPVAMPEESSSDFVPFIRTLRALSGPYLPWAERLSARVKRFSAQGIGVDPLEFGGSNMPEEPVSDPCSKTVTKQHSRAVPERVAPMPEGQAAADRGEPGSMNDAYVRPMGPVERAIAERRKAGSPPPVWGNVPPRNVNFTGRVLALQDLHARLTQGTTAILPEALHGMGGVGKSQIAIEYAYRHSSDYDIVWWIPAEQPAQIRAAFVDLAQRLRLPTSAEANTAVPAVLEALRLGEPYRNWLLVFDNAESPETVTPFFPRGGTGRILVTSRNGQWVNMARTIEVDVFARAESIELLRRRGPELTDEKADRLSEALGDLPLAIEQAAVWLTETGMLAEEYLELFEGKREEFVNRRAELLELAPPMDYQLPVAAAWNVSLDRLRDTNPGALQLLQVCAYFAPEPVSRSLFIAGRNAALPGLLGQVLSDPIRLGQALREVNRYALARIDHRTNSIQLHRLVQAVLIDQMSPEERESMREAAHLLLAGGDPGEPGMTANWPRYAELLPHIRASRAVDCDNHWVRNLIVNTVTYLFTWGDHDACLELAQEALQTWRANIGPDDAQTLTVARYCGHVLRALSRYSEASQLDEDSLERRRRTVGDTHEDTLLAARAVAVDMRAAGDFASSVKLNKEAYEQAVRAFGERDPQTIAAGIDYGTALRLTGEFTTARDLDAVSLQLAVDVLGEDSLLTMMLVSLLAVDLRECGDYVGACEMQENNSIRFERLAGSETPITLMALRHLGEARRKAGDHEGGLSACLDAWERNRRRYGDNHLNTQCAASSLVIAQRQADRLDEAVELGRKTLDQFKRSLGESHPFTSGVMTNLAVSLRRKGQTEEALALNRQAHDGLIATVGPNHPYTLSVAINLASDLFALGNTQDAAEMDEETLRRTTQELGDLHPTTLACALNVSADLRTLGRATRAETLYAATLSSLRQVLGQEHPATAAATRSDRADCDAEVFQI